MNQSFDTVLQVVQRALGETVLPALSGADKHVIEQLHLSLAGLGFLKARLPESRAFQRRELEDAVALARDCAALAPEAGPALPALADAAHSLLQDPVADTDDYVASTRQLRELIAQAVEASAGKPHEAALDALVLAHGARAQRRARAWCEPFGFELTPLGPDSRDW